MPEFVGPVQPMTGAMAQENFAAMVNHVIQWNPDFPPGLAKRRLNVHLREAQDIRLWGGLMSRGEFAVPNQYNTGTISITTGSDLATGTLTAWPAADLVNTTLSAAVTVANELQDLTPAAITNISAGDYLLVDEGLATEEYLLVFSVTATTFKARPTKTHLLGGTVTKSSLVGRQLKVGNDRNYYTIIGVTSAQGLKLDHTWSHPDVTSGTYYIVLVYLTMPIGLRCLWSIVNCRQGWRIKFNLPQEILARWDAWRSPTGDPYLLVDFMPDAIGRVRYELYPAATVATGIPYLAYRTIADLSEDEDCPPTCIPSHLLVNATIADALLFNPKSPYYDARSSKDFRAQAIADLQGASLADDNIYMQNLQWAYEKYPFMQRGDNYWYDHDYDF